MVPNTPRINNTFRLFPRGCKLSFLIVIKQILILTKDKKLTDKYKISLDVVKEAYPRMTWGGRS